MARVTHKDARAILGDSIVTDPPRITTRTCSKPRCTDCGRHSRLHLGRCRGCTR